MFWEEKLTFFFWERIRVLFDLFLLFIIQKLVKTRGPDFLRKTSQKRSFLGRTGIVIYLPIFSNFYQYHD